VTDKNCEKMQNIIRSVPFMQLLEMEVKALDGDTLTMDMPFTNQLSRMTMTNQVHGGAISALIDSAATFLVVSKLEHGVPTINYRTDFLKPAVGGSGLSAKATMRRLGRSVAVVDVDVTDESGALIAIGRGTFGTSEG